MRQWLQPSLLFILRSRIKLFSILAVGLTSLLHGQSLPKAPGSQVLPLTPDNGHFVEPSIAINPANPQQIVAVFEVNAGAAYSQDAGHAWKLAQGLAPVNYKFSGDVSTAFDKHGHAFIAYIAADKLGTFYYWGHNATRNGLFVRRSLDGGATWEKDPIVVAEHPTQPGIPFEDKSYIVSDTSNSRFAGNLYVGWTRWTLTGSEILLSRSTDDGQTWSTPVEIDGHPGLPRDDKGEHDGFDGTVGPDGSLYAVWADAEGIALTISRDGGRTFSPVQTIIHTAPLQFDLQAVNDANGFPQIAIDPRSQRLYVTWSDYRNGDVDVFCATSTDHGKTWSAPVRVNNDPVHDGADQFYQWLAVDPADGAANIVFYDRRADPENRLQTVTLARSTDGGLSFQNYAWTTAPFDSTGIFLGDYIGIAAFGGRVYGVWTEKPVAPAEPGDKNGSKPDEQSDKTKQPVSRNTVVKVGIADFNSQ